jgi:hypothetical protein
MSAVAEPDVVALAQEAERLKQRMAEKELDPEARLAEIEAALDSHWEHEHERRVMAQAEFERVLAEYGPARDEADEATRILVEKVTRAVELRRQLDAARKRAGGSAPPRASIRASRDRAFRELRQDARLAAGQDY